MAALKVRKIDFQFDDSMPYQAFPETPEWGNFVNLITLIAPAFEKYFIRAIRLAMSNITDEIVKEDAERFCAQEAQHARHHNNHLQVLTRHYPNLKETDQKVKDSYQKLFENESMEFHLGYAATVESFFGPIAKFVIENREILFKGSHEKIASFILWHLVEEFEHRNAALDVYNHVVDDYLYRLKTAPKVFKHIFEIQNICLDGMKEHVYLGNAKGMPMPHKAFDIVSIRCRLKFFYHLLCTLLPYHAPDNLKQPEWVTQWFEDEEAGVDMREYYPKVDT